MIGYLSQIVRILFPIGDSETTEFALLTMSNVQSIYCIIFRCIISKFGFIILLHSNNNNNYTMVAKLDGNTEVGAHVRSYL